MDKPDPFSCGFRLTNAVGMGCALHAISTRLLLPFAKLSEGPLDGFDPEQINIVTHGQRMRLRISGRYRPSQLGRVEIRFVNGSDTRWRRIDQLNTQIVNLSSDSSVRLTGNATFVPNQTIRNGG